MLNICADQATCSEFDHFEEQGCTTHNFDFNNSQTMALCMIFYDWSSQLHTQLKQWPLQYGIAEVMGSNPVQAWIFFSGLNFTTA